MVDAEILDAHHVGVSETFLVLGTDLFCVHDDRCGILPCGRRAGTGLYAAALAHKPITTPDVYVYDALKTPQFWLLWGVLCMNVTAGIGVLGQASPMSQEMFPGQITPSPLPALSAC